MTLKHLCPSLSAPWTILLGGLLLLAPGTGRAEGNTNTPPNLDEVRRLLRENLPLSGEELDKVLVQGLFKELPGRVEIVPGLPSASADVTESNLLSGTRVVDQNYLVLRIGTVATNLAAKITDGLAARAGTNRLKGLVLDLRDTGGDDYAAAAATAGLFLNSEEPILSWGDQTARASLNSKVLTLPVTVLVNPQTSGAAEALAAILQETRTALLLGTNTAGRAYVYKEFPLEGGQRLRLATTSVKSGSDQPLPADGLTPDILVKTSAEQEKIWFADPYLSVGGTNRVTNAVTATNATGTVTTNQSRGRLNEAELIRRHRQGKNELDDEGDNASRRSEPPPLIMDPVLARAVDLLKGLAVIRPER